jgi:hypothetical protein
MSAVWSKAETDDAAQKAAAAAEAAKGSGPTGKGPPPAIIEPSDHIGQYNNLKATNPYVAAAFLNANTSKVFPNFK